MCSSMFVQVSIESKVGDMDDPRMERAGTAIGWSSMRRPRDPTVCPTLRCWALRRPCDGRRDDRHGDYQLPGSTSSSRPFRTAQTTNSCFVSIANLSWMP